MKCLHDPANIQQTSSKCIQNTRANAGRLLDRVNTLLASSGVEGQSPWTVVRIAKRPQRLKLKAF